MPPTKFGVGQAVRRKEDQSFITGTGRYVDDESRSGVLRAYVLRSPYAHARFSIGDLSEASAMPGVRLILTAADLDGLGDLPCLALMENADGSPQRPQPYPLLARDVVRHVGDAVAFVVADSLIEARDAAEAIPVDYESLDAIVGSVAALEPGASLVWPEHGSNLAFDAQIGNARKVAKAFEKAARVVSLDVVNNRLVANYMETRGCLAEWDGQRLTLTVGSQGVHSIRDTLANHVFKVKPDKVHVKTGDVGGGFGTKAFMYREYPLSLEAARRLGKPVKWFADRAEHFLADTQGRDNISRIEAALDRRSRIQAVKIDIIGDLGAYLSQFGPFIPWLGALMATGAYAISAMDVRVRGVFTNTLPVDAYRGAGRPEAAYLIERLMDAIAFETGLSVDTVRMRNFVKPEQMPFKAPTGRTYDSGDFEGHMRKAMDVAGWGDFKGRWQASKKAGKFRGIGMSTYIEACADGPKEAASVTLEKDGTATVLIGTQTNGQGHLTAYAQFVSQYLDLPLERINVIQGDSDLIKTGGGTGGSRSIPVGGASVARASQTLAEKLKTLASDELEAGIADLEIVEGRVRVVGTDKAIDFAALARLPKATPDLLSAETDYQPGEATYPNGTHICELEIDPQTGVTDILGYTIVDDFGMVVNPLLLEGQVHGGVVQGIGQALLERTVYSEDGQLLTASLTDYALPRADDLPFIHFETRNIPCKNNPLGVKGAGEAGTIGAAPAVMNAVIDALRRGVGVTKLDMPATPEVVWRTIQDAQARKLAAE
ncbi:xanthine dehydrogenase family protein molybdopterin-binding subunit [Labrys sp. KNU-23]|uniref:xanthine dehydrogenase family protein molybdopterin-binding subunit n=1 Tax=Labrys sp. KNU-23 TaxID=2789216 RepID=UPI0011EF1487|nr:xanthine dehydrogenase family protein molybdopterin-binding subunit [Labrys sp. KNU-23]QEN90743.1 xanthine dehydrogenase family protein molybdopterin-binding subunit [Labrys sp. KNU-23]